MSPDRRPRAGRPPAPGLARERFESDLDQAVAGFERILDATDHRPTQREAAEAMAIRIAVALEAFLSDWVIRSLAEDPEVFRSAREEAARKELSHRYKRWLTDAFGDTAQDVPIELELTVGDNLIPAKPTLDQSRTLLRAGDEHLRFGNAEDFVAQAQVRLGASYAARARALNPRQCAVVDLTRSLRNSLAHGSPKSSELLRRDTREATLPPSLRITGARNVRRAGIGTYLCYRRPGTRVRWRVLVASLRAAARTLDP